MRISSTRSFSESRPAVIAAPVCSTYLALPSFGMRVALAELIVSWNSSLSVNTNSSGTRATCSKLSWSLCDCQCLTFR
ncbi:hypothetical protein D3C78_1637070 [compost metagenome]